MFAQQPANIAYVSMEIACHPGMHTYSGGLGVLAGDFLRSAADCGVPVIGITLVNRRGYFHQSFDQHHQVENADEWQPESFARRLEPVVQVPIGDHDVSITAWLHMLGSGDNPVPVLFLDSDLPDNRDQDRRITDQLYGGDAEYRLQQEILLGIGAFRMLKALGITIRRYHLNEGHAALLPLELLREMRQCNDLPIAGPLHQYEVSAIRELCCFTTHTPVSAGHDRFPLELARRLLMPNIDAESLLGLSDNDSLNMTDLAMTFCGSTNAVSGRHAETVRHMHPDCEVRFITNGVHAETWTCPSFAQLFDSRLPGWRQDPGILADAIHTLNDQEVWHAHLDARQRLLSLLAQRYLVHLDPGLPILGFARRMTGYKRPELLFNDLDRLRAIARHHPFQILLAGKAHPRDHHGREVIRHIRWQLKTLYPEIPCAFVPNYEMDLARILIPGVDIWINTPVPPLEASGTSGMKAALNGVPGLSVLDGWWLEGCIEGETGWSIDARPAQQPAHHADGLYEKLSKEILPLYYDNRDGWISIMKNAISRNGAYFNSHRMLRQYIETIYSS